MTNHLILSYGAATELWRASFAVLSFYSWLGDDRTDVQTIIYTDQPTFFEPLLGGLPVRYELLSAAQLHQMKGPEQYIHRVKLAIVGEVCQRYPDHQLLFCDSDTFCRSGVRPLLAALKSGDVSFMHEREISFDETVAQHAQFQPPGQEQFPLRFLELLGTRTFPVIGQQRRFTKDQSLWNSGVLGLPTTMTATLPDILALNDVIYAHTRWIISEQVAFSLALPLQTILLPSNTYVTHYWGKGQKQLMDGLLQELGTDRFQRLTLPQRLAETKRLTAKWERRIRAHLAQEGALYSLSRGQTLAGLRCVAKALLVKPLDVTFTRQVMLAIGRRQSS